MGNRHFAWSLLTIGLLISGCAPRVVEQPMTQLQVRDIQSREFNTCDTKLVMKSMMNVLQDEGFIIKNAVFELGLLNAEKNINVENKTKAFMAAMCNGVNARWEKQQILEASANISEYGDKTRVRMNFQAKTLDNFGCPQDVQTILDGQYYRDFFEKVSKGIFLQQASI
jgi:PBP1b-binding outer membrane lipoprotein LpoB